MGRHGHSRSGWGGSSGKSKGGFFGLFRPKPLGGSFKTELDITNWFLSRGIKNIRHVEINPEPDDYLDYRSCEIAIELYAKSMRYFYEDGLQLTDSSHQVYRRVIESNCGFRIDNSDVYFEK